MLDTTAACCAAPCRPCRVGLARPARPTGWVLGSGADSGAANSSAVMSVTIRSADLPVVGCGSPSCGPTTEWNDVRHGSPQLVLGPDAMLQVRRSSALGGSPSAFGRLFLLWLRRARVFSTGQRRPEQLALALQLGNDEALYALAQLHELGHGIFDRGLQLIHPGISARGVDTGPDTCGLPEHVLHARLRAQSVHRGQPRQQRHGLGPLLPVIPTAPSNRAAGLQLAKRLDHALHEAPVRSRACSSNLRACASSASLLGNWSEDTRHQRKAAALVGAYQRLDGRAARAYSVRQKCKRAPPPYDCHAA